MTSPSPTTAGASREDRWCRHDTAADDIARLRSPSARTSNASLGNRSSQRPVKGTLYIRRQSTSSETGRRRTPSDRRRSSYTADRPSRHCSLVRGLWTRSGVRRSDCAGSNRPYKRCDTCLRTALAQHHTMSSLKKRSFLTIVETDNEFTVTHRHACTHAHISSLLRKKCAILY